MLNRKIEQLEERLHQLESNPQKVIIYKKSLLMSLVEKLKDSSIKLKSNINKWILKY